MKLISIDVGIRNLAVCVLEGTGRQDVSITHWEVIDILGEKNGLAKPLCFKCSKPAMWKHPESETQLACTRHCPNKNTSTKTSLNKKTLPELQGIMDQIGLRIASKKKADVVNALYGFYRSSSWQKLAGGANVKHAPVLDLAPDICRALDRRMDAWRNADKVVFENQLDRRMFAVQAMLHMFFVSRGFRCEGVSASHKLSNIVTIDDRVTTYRGRKKTGIVHAEALCPPSNLSYFRSHKKKDDLADCFLQGLWCLEHVR
jgi:hypothetical protein